jgi:enoyl-CoA hydratase/carnithine racemase
MTMTDPILLHRDGAVATLTINRPAALNAMDSRAHLMLSDALDVLATDDALRVIVLTGAGEQAFSVGRDLKEMAISDPGELAVIENRWRSVTRLTDRFDYPKPIIAKVRGLALGGGFELALACDLIICADDASFALPEPKRGLIPFAGGVHRLPRKLPPTVAMGHLLTGRSIDAARAYALGLVNEVVPAATLDESVKDWIDDIIACAPLAIRSIKECVVRGMDRPLRDAMSATYPAEESRRASQDSLEGPRAFAEKRPPIWTGR